MEIDKSCSFEFEYTFLKFQFYYFIFILYRSTLFISSIWNFKVVKAIMTYLSWLLFISNR